MNADSRSVETRLEATYRNKFNQQSFVIKEHDPQWMWLKAAIHYGPQSIAALDAGCGNGNYAIKVKKQFPNVSVSAIDLFENPLFDAQNTEINYLKSSITETPFADQSFELIYSLSVIHYLEDFNKGIMEFQRILKPKGLIIISAHTRDSIPTLIRKAKRKYQWGELEHLHDLQFRTVKTYTQAFEKAGFRIVKQDGFYWNFFARALRRLKISYKLTGINLKKESADSFFLKQIRNFCSRHSYHFMLILQKK